MQYHWEHHFRIIIENWKRIRKILSINLEQIKLKQGKYHELIEKLLFGNN